METHKTFHWIKIAENVGTIAFGANNIAVIETDEKRLCVAKHNEGLFAFAHKCPHAGGLFAEGWVDVLGNVVCPLHRYKFCLKNGRNVSGEGYYLKQWPVEIRGDGVWVGLEKSGLFPMF